ncbi:hypothetical protein C4561_04570 [candidate division WWE3 bacterium]|jgi:chromosome segregation ATPase|uniref:Uncharacterized protein n=1 Tax=candidate division WWE3 bacterium TaxID=2053526 RepID=A0A3A4ZCS7_UNCKA|nr:MAG: hypothetical protein C4561_04570 [candidate division WWE3 bacterium]
MIKKNLTLIVASFVLLISAFATHNVYAQSVEDSGCVPPREKNSESIAEYKECLRRYKQTFLEEYKTRQKEIKQEREEVKTQLQETRAERCDIVEGQMDARIDQYRAAQENHLARYTALKEKLANLITRLEEQGYDVTKLQEDLLVLEDKIAVLTQRFEEFVVQLEETTNFECGDSNGDFLTAMQESRNALSLVRQSALDVKNYYVNTVKQDIVALRDQIREVSKEDSRMLKPSSNTNGL